MIITAINELEMLKKENAALKEELKRMKNRLAFQERQLKAYIRDWSKTAEKLRELKAKLKELAE